MLDRTDIMDAAYAADPMFHLSLRKFSRVGELLSNAPIRVDIRWSGSFGRAQNGEASSAFWEPPENIKFTSALYWVAIEMGCEPHLRWGWVKIPGNLNPEKTAKIIAYRVSVIDETDRHQIPPGNYAGCTVRMANWCYEVTSTNPSVSASLRHIGRRVERNLFWVPYENEYKLMRLLSRLRDGFMKTQTTKPRLPQCVGATVQALNGLVTFQSTRYVADDEMQILKSVPTLRYAGARTWAAQVRYIRSFTDAVAQIDALRGAGNG